MLLTIDRDVLFDGLTKTVPITEKRSTLPILSHVLMDGEEGRLVISSTDLEVGLQVKVDSEIEESGSLTLPGRKLFDIVRELPSAPVRMGVSDTGRASITCANSSFELAMMDPADYPAWSSEEQVETVSLTADKLLRLIDKTLFAASTDDSRFNLNGVLFEVSDNRTKVVSTDGHRLAMIEEEISLALESKAVVPRKGLLEIKRVFEGVKDDVSVGFEPKNMRVGAERFSMTVRLLDGDYPDYRKVVPEKGSRNMTVDRHALTHTLKRVAVLTTDRHKGIDMKIAPGTMHLSVTHPDLGTAHDSVEAEYDGDEFELIVNVSYMIEALNVIETDEVSLEFEREGSPLIIRPKPAKTYFNLVMPMRK